MIDAEKLLGWKFPVIEQSYDERDAILYALGIGMGGDQADSAQLRYLYEDKLAVFPTFGLVLGHPGPWFRDPATGIDWVAVLHGEQEIVFHRPLLPHDEVICHTRVTDVVDKGPGRGALVYWERELTRKATGEKVCTALSTLVCRNNGGFGGPARPSPTPRVFPDREPDLTVEQAISARAGLLYRLSGDLNPLHVDPQVARQAGFSRPILHGLCTFAMAGRAIVESCLGFEHDRLGALRARFSAPVYPGETLRTQIWRAGEGFAFRCRSAERDAVVIDQGWASEVTA